jgi:hypothetical protein
MLRTYSTDQIAAVIAKLKKEAKASSNRIVISTLDTGSSYFFDTIIDQGV